MHTKEIKYRKERNLLIETSLSSQIFTSFLVNKASQFFAHYTYRKIVTLGRNLHLHKHNFLSHLLQEECCQVLLCSSSYLTCPGSCCPVTVAERFVCCPHPPPHCSLESQHLPAAHLHLCHEGRFDHTIVPSCTQDDEANEMISRQEKSLICSKSVFQELPAMLGFLVQAG